MARAAALSIRSVLPLVLDLMAREISLPMLPIWRGKGNFAQRLLARVGWDSLIFCPIIFRPVVYDANNFRFNIFIFYIAATVTLSWTDVDHRVKFNELVVWV